MVQLIIDDASDGVTRVALVGRLDVRGMHEVDLPFHEATASAGRHTLVDCTRLEFVASLGMGMLFGCASSLRSGGKRMFLVGPPPEVAEALRIAGIDQAASIVDGEATALAQLD